VGKSRLTQEQFAAFVDIVRDKETGWLRLATPNGQFLPLAGGSDGDRLREIDVVELPLVPFLYSERLLRSRQRPGIGRYATVAKGPRIPREQWSEVSAQADREGLRNTARELGVSHETVRAIVKWLEQTASAT
jgi:hypothetical protein